MNRSLRLRLTLLYTALFAVLFIAFSAIFYHVISRALYQRLDSTLASEADTAAGLLTEEFKEGDKPPAAAQEIVEDMKLHGDVVTVMETPGNHVLASTGPLPRNVHQARRAILLGGVGYLVIVSAPLHPVNEELEIVRGVIFIGLPLALLAAGIGAWLLATGALRPLRDLAEQAHSITESNLGKRLVLPGAVAELEVVISGFNDLLARLDLSFETMRRFVADASHELRTPVSVIRGEADVSLSRERAPGEYRDTLNVILDESRRLSTLIDDLLNLARADASALRLGTDRFYLNELVADCCREVESRAVSRGLALTCEAGDDIPFQGDEQMLRRVVMNLLDNAIRYTSDGGTITARTAASGNTARIQVTDTGIGIAAEHTVKIFERFYRADSARSRDAGGFGLGLSIVKWVAEAHQGTVECVSRPGAGSTFTVTLPVSRADS